MQETTCLERKFSPKTYTSPAIIEPGFRAKPACILLGIYASLPPARNCDVRLDFRDSVGEKIYAIQNAFFLPRPVINTSQHTENGHMYGRMVFVVRSCPSVCLFEQGLFVIRSRPNLADKLPD